MSGRIGTILVLALLPLGVVYADTIHLKNGVRFDGVVTPLPGQEGVYRVQAGERQLIYRESEIAKVEKNNKTGHLDKQALMDRWEEKNKRLTEETGLTAEQRRMVRGLMFELKSEDMSKRIAVRDKLQGLQQEIDVYGYLSTLYPELSPLMAPNVLWVLAHLDSKRSIELLQGATQQNYAEVRAIAIELLARMRHRESIPLLTRGLADFSQPVQISAAYAMAELGVRNATPALISLLANPDRRVSNATREALTAIWADRLGDKRPNTVSEWETFWNAQAPEGTPLLLAELEVLSPEEDEMVQTFDHNN